MNNINIKKITKKITKFINLYSKKSHSFATYDKNSNHNKRLNLVSRILGHPDYNYIKKNNIDYIDFDKLNILINKNLVNQLQNEFNSNFIDFYLEDLIQFKNTLLLFLNFNNIEVLNEKIKTIKNNLNLPISHSFNLMIKEYNNIAIDYSILDYFLFPEEIEKSLLYTYIDLLNLKKIISNEIIDLSFWEQIFSSKQNYLPIMLSLYLTRNLCEEIEESFNNSEFLDDDLNYILSFDNIISFDINIEINEKLKKSIISAIILNEIIYKDSDIFDFQYSIELLEKIFNNKLQEEYLNENLEYLLSQYFNFDLLFEFKDSYYYNELLNLNYIKKSIFNSLEYLLIYDTYYSNLLTLPNNNESSFFLNSEWHLISKVVNDIFDNVIKIINNKKIVFNNKYFFEYNYYLLIFKKYGNNEILLEYLLPDYRFGEIVDFFNGVTHYGLINKNNNILYCENPADFYILDFYLENIFLLIESEIKAKNIFFSKEKFEEKIENIFNYTFKFCLNKFKQKDVDDFILNNKDILSSLKIKTLIIIENLKKDNSITNHKDKLIIKGIFDKILFDFLEKTYIN